MKRILLFIANHPIWILTVVFSITIFMILGLGKIKTQPNLYLSELPDNDSIVKSIRYLEKTFGDKDVVLVGIENDNILTPQTLKKVEDISNELKEMPEIENNIISLTDIVTMKGKDMGLEVGPFIKVIPQTDSAMNQLALSIKNNRLIRSSLISNDNKFTVIVASVKEGYNPKALAEKLYALRLKYLGNDKIYLAGDPIQQEEIDKGIQSDVRKLLPIGLILILVVYYFSFSSVAGVFIPFFSVIITLIWTMGIMGYMGFSLNVVTSTIPLVMIAVGSSYGIHILHRYFYEKTKANNPLALQNTVVNIFPAIWMAGITSAIGSFTLIIFKVQSIKEFGIVCSIGIVLTIIVSLLLVPSLISILKPEHIQRKNRFKLDKPLRIIAKITIDYKKTIVVSSILLFALSFWGAYKVRVGNDFKEYFPHDHILRKTFNEFNDKLGGASYLDVMVDCGEPDGIKNPETLQQIADFQKFLGKQDGVGNTSSFVDIIMQMNSEMHGGDTLFHSIPNNKNLIAQYLLLYSMSGNPDDFESIVDYDYQRTKIRVMLKTTEQDEHLKLYKIMSDYAMRNFSHHTKVAYGGDVIFWLAQIKYIVKGKIENIICSILIVLLFCIISFRSFTGGLLSIIPLSISCLMTFGLMGFLGIRLETGTAVITSISIGVGIDFAIHYILRFKEEINKGLSMEGATQQTILTSGEAILFNMFSNVCGFICFIFSGFIPLKNFGWLISFTMITVALGSIIILPSVINILRPKFLEKKNKT